MSEYSFSDGEVGACGFDEVLVEVGEFLGLDIHADELENFLCVLIGLYFGAWFLESYGFVFDFEPVSDFMGEYDAFHFGGHP